MAQAQISIQGYLVGDTWMPNCEAYKPLNYDVTREARRHVGSKATLRDHILAATNDGDFQGAEIAWGELVVRTHKRRGDTYITRTRVWPLDKFQSVADCIRADWDGPLSDDE